MCAPRRAAAVVRPRGREKSADRRRRILISRLLIIRASVPRWKSPFPAYFKGFPAVSPLIPPYPAFLKYPVSPHLGYVKDVDWIEELITVPEDEATIQRWEKISDFVLKRHRLHIHEARNRLSYLPLLKPFFELVNLAYAPLYGTVDLSDRQIKKYSAKFAPLINPNTTCFVMDENDRMVAFGVGAPSLASALQKHRGRLMPTGWIDVLKAFHRNDTVDLLLIAVHPDYQKKGVNAIILSKAMKGCHKLGIKQAETGPMLELNDKVQSQWKDFQTEQHKRRRCFIKQL